MKKKIILGSIILVFMLLTLPVTTAVQINSGLIDIKQKNNFKEITNMDINEVIDFLIKTTEDYPQIQEEIIKQIEELEETNNEITIKRAESNQSIIQKIWQLVLRYRFFRFSFSLFLYISFPSKITMWRTLTWSVKIINWIKIGIILGTVDPDFWKHMYTPEIIFEMDEVNNTLTVIQVNPDDILWEDIEQIGSGDCDPFPTGTVEINDEITGCTGIIILRYKPTGQLIGIYEFE